MIYKPAIGRKWSYISGQKLLIDHSAHSSTIRIQNWMHNM